MLPNLSAVPHYFINSHSIREEVNAAMYEQLALQYAADIFHKASCCHYCKVVMPACLYQGFLEGMDEMPPVPADTWGCVRDNYAANGLTWLQNPATKRSFFLCDSRNANPQRLMRALEVLEATGQSVKLHSRTATPHNRDFRNIIKNRDTITQRTIARKYCKTCGCHDGGWFDKRKWNP